MKFNFVFLGQSILKYRVPFDIYLSINEIYEQKFKQLIPANEQLVGKIKKEHSLFYNGEDEKIMQKHNLLPLTILKWFEECYKHYLDWNRVKEYKIHLNSIWVNEMKENEYNPVHVHQGNLFTGLSSVMILKLPKSFGDEYSSKDHPQNGRLQLLGSASGQFANVDYEPKVVDGDFYVFPYDLRHLVYPFNGPGYRRTLAANCDVKYNEMINRGVS
jgi:hypothetical protein|tara:strand:- start:78 stop:725 length:648 start_codon:yes stop_codon:yes gene_type:complete